MRLARAGLDGNGARCPVQVLDADARRRPVGNRNRRAVAGAQLGFLGREAIAAHHGAMELGCRPDRCPTTKGFEIVDPVVLILADAVEACPLVRLGLALVAEATTAPPVLTSLPQSHILHPPPQGHPT